ncbi:MAG: cell division protein FtsZ [Candidatus Doudnabacteria bacterium]|nr:cell division protein FtsZ [Candidatus Doudnabacteria bacterium]
MAEVKPKIQSFARIKVLGIGGSGTSAVNRMSELGIKGVEFIAINTDAQALHNNHADIKVHIGKGATKGLGSGMNPELGRQAAEESIEELEEVVENADMVFITCGLGGGTGTGASPIVAELAKNKGVLTVALVTKPFTFEGSKRKEVAEAGYDNLKDKVDAVIAIQNDRILRIIDKKTSLIDAFKTVDEVLRQGISGISDLITTHGLVNADFADVKAIMQDAGTAMMGIGRASGETRAAEAARLAINSPLLDMSLDGAKGVLFNITGGRDLGMFEIDEAAKVITKNIDPDAKVKFGAVIDESLGDEIKITVIATGFDGAGGVPASLSQSFEDSKKGFNMPSFFSSQNPASQPSPAMEVRKPLFNPQSAQPKPFSQTPPQAQTPSKLEEDDELEIPAFIRKKMK